jgi:hypothetical protein
MNTIQCLLCKKQFKRITTTHLRHEHNMSYDEKHHFQKNGQLKHKDYIRQQNILDELQCKFIRINYKGEISIYEKNY